MSYGMMHTMDARLLKRFVRGHEAASALSRRAACPPSDPTDAFLAAMELWEINRALLDQPPDRVRERDVLRARVNWARLHARLRA